MWQLPWAAPSPCRVTLSSSASSSSRCFIFSSLYILLLAIISSMIYATCTAVSACITARAAQAGGHMSHLLSCFTLSSRGAFLFAPTKVVGANKVSHHVIIQVIKVWRGLPAAGSRASVGRCSCLSPNRPQQCTSFRLSARLRPKCVRANSPLPASLSANFAPAQQAQTATLEALHCVALVQHVHLWLFSGLSALARARLAAWPRPFHPRSVCHQPLHRRAPQLKCRSYVYGLQDALCSSAHAPPKRRSMKLLAFRSCLYSTSSVLLRCKAGLCVRMQSRRTQRS